MKNEKFSTTQIPNMLKVVEIAQMFKLPVHFVRTLVNNGEVVAVRVGNKILVNADRFKEYINSHTLQKTESVSATESNALSDDKSRIFPISRKRGNRDEK